MIYFIDYLIRNSIWSSLINFDPFWTDLIQKNQKQIAIFILSVNVTNFYRNIFRLVRKSNLIKFDQGWSSLIKVDQVWSILDRSGPKKSKIKLPFLSFLKCYQFLGLFTSKLSYLLDSEQIWQKVSLFWSKTNFGSRSL